MDGTYEFLLDFKEKYGTEYESIIIERVNKRGLTFARNICLKYADGFVFWLDSDVIVPRTILEVLLSHLQRDKKHGWASAPYHHKNPNLFEKLFIAREPNPYGYVDFAEIGAALIRPEVWKSVGPFNEHLGYPHSCNWDTNDYCARIRKAGWKILLDTTVCCTHLRRSDIIDIENERPIMVSNASKSSLLGDLWEIIRNVDRHLRHYFREVPLGVYEVIKAGDFKYFAKIMYYFLLPYIVFTALLIQQPMFILYVFPSLVYYIAKTHGRVMKLLACILIIPANIIIALGYVFLLLMLMIKKFK
jgi:glycosyltransferase involved in cell wall biosynthesis